MVGISGLWMPIVLSAVAIFILSSLIHMVLGWHKGEFHQLPGGEAVADAIRAAGVTPGEYLAPYSGSMEAMKAPEFKARLERGPNFILTVRTPGNAMGKMLGLWFVYGLVVSVFVAYVTGRTHHAGDSYLSVFRTAGAVTTLAFAAGHWQHWIWWGKSTRFTITNTLDGLIYGLFVAGIFGAMWPR